MIIATNRQYKGSDTKPNWHYDPEPQEGTVHWLDVTKATWGYDVNLNKTTTGKILPQKFQKKLKAELDGSAKPKILVFIPGVRRFEYSDFLKFERKIISTGFQGVVVGYSPPFRAYNANFKKQYHRSHFSRRSLSNFVDGLSHILDDYRTTGGTLSFMLQSAGNDLFARMLDVRKEDNLKDPSIDQVISAACAIDRDAFSKNLGIYVPAKDSKPVTDARLLPEVCSHLSVFYRSDDRFLDLVSDMEPAGVDPLRDPYMHPKKVSLVDCEPVPGKLKLKHKSYEKHTVILQDIVEVLTVGKTGDRTLP